jgi:hypothetical protein
VLTLILALAALKHESHLIAGGCAGADVEDSTHAGVRDGAEDNGMVLALALVVMLILALLLMLAFALKNKSHRIAGGCAGAGAEDSTCAGVGDGTEDDGAGAGTGTGASAGAGAECWVLMLVLALMLALMLVLKMVLVQMLALVLSVAPAPMHTSWRWCLHCGAGLQCWHVVVPVTSKFFCIFLDGWCASLRDSPLRACMATRKNLSLEIWTPTHRTKNTRCTWAGGTLFKIILWLM